MRADTHSAKIGEAEKRLEKRVFPLFFCRREKRKKRDVLPQMLLSGREEGVFSKRVSLHKNSFDIFFWGNEGLERGSPWETLIHPEYSETETTILRS